MKNALERLDENLLVFDVSPVLKDFHKKYGKCIIPELKNMIHISTYYYWVSGKSPVPIKYLKFFSKFDPKILDKSYKKMSYLSAGVKKYTLPRIMEKKLSYLLGMINGDGHVHRNGKFITITSDSEEYLIKTASPLFKALFGTGGHIYKFGVYYRLEVGSKVAHSFISLFCPVGKKTGKLSIPDEIKSNKENMVNYFSGLFDTDGCINSTKDGKQVYFVFVQRDKKFVFEVYHYLKSLGINLNEPRMFLSPKKPYERGRELEEWRIYIGSKKTLLDFLNKIKFKNPDKKRKAEKVMKIIMGPAGFEPAIF
jgi:hypothetical protein